jgi:small nuclear ribonucleoprotein (snRNP)-like protein
VTGVVLLGFFAYLYLPHVSFKAAAELYVDLGRKQNASQLEEIASAVLPSAVLHILTFAIFKFVGLLTPLHLPPVDWTFIASTVSAGEQPWMSVLGSRELYWTVAYAAGLLAISAANGAMYGRSRYLKVILSADPRLHPDAETEAKRVNRIRASLIIAATFLWDVMYGEYYVAIHRWSILRPYVFVKTKEGQLLHGRFSRYDRTRNGEVEAVTLVQVSRYTRAKLNEVLERGNNPISRLEGEIYVKWSEIVDINVTTPQKLTELWQQYEQERLSPRSSSDTAP